VLDVTSGEDGFSICLRLRNVNRLPVVMVTSRARTWTESWHRTGADDYLVKPFIHANCSRHRRRSPAKRAGARGEKATESIALRVRPRIAYTRLSRPSGARVILTSAEFETLLTLCQRPGRVFSRDQLKSRRPRTKRRHHVSRLRQKIEKTRATQS